MATLYVMCGAPASGKSTWALKFYHNRVNMLYVSRDRIRFTLIKDDEEYFSKEKQVFNDFVDKIMVGLKQGMDVIADATHNTVASRKKLISAITARGISPDSYHLVFIFMAATYDTLYERNNQRTGRAKVPLSVLRRMNLQTEPPEIGEYKNSEVWVIYE